jgi:hypothetical protein
MLNKNNNNYKQTIVKHYKTTYNVIINVFQSK